VHACEKPSAVGGEGGGEGGREKTAGASVAAVSRKQWGLLMTSSQCAHVSQALASPCQAIMLMTAPWQAVGGGWPARTAPLSAPQTFSQAP
jgi:hypothetical protein